MKPSPIETAMLAAKVAGDSPQNRHGIAIRLLSDARRFLIGKGCKELTPMQLCELTIPICSSPRRPWESLPTAFEAWELAIADSVNDSKMAAYMEGKRKDFADGMELVSMKDDTISLNAWLAQMLPKKKTHGERLRRFREYLCQGRWPWPEKSLHERPIEDVAPIIEKYRENGLTIEEAAKEALAFKQWDRAFTAYTSSRRAKKASEAARLKKKNL